MKCLAVKSFLDGYNTKHLPYEDLTYATLAGFHGGRNFYQTYCFICACMINWGGFHDNILQTDYERRVYILEKLCLRLRTYDVNNREEFYQVIEDNIEKGIPLHMPVKDRTVFFKTYNNGNKRAGSSFIICGCDKEHKYVVIQDAALTKWNLQHHFRGEVFCRLQMTYEMLETIRSISARLFAQHEKQEPYQLHTIELDETKKGMGITDNIRYFMEGMKVDKLQEAVMGFNSFLQEDKVKKNPKSHAAVFLCLYYRTLSIIFETLEKAVRKSEEADLEGFKEVEQRYLDTREEVISNLAEMIIDQKTLTNEKQTEFIYRLEKGNKELLLQLQKFNQ